MYSEAKNRIEYEIAEIDRLFETYKLLFEKASETEPDLIEIAAFATVLHSFYNGVEKVFLIIAKNIDNLIPTENKWHTELLIQMTNKTDKRNAVITSETKLALVEYMGFRHFYRHSYSYQLSWNKLKELVLNVQNIWDMVKNDTSLFAQSL